jgi:hypothetical protein
MLAGVHEAFVDVGGAKLRLLKGGAGALLLILRGTEGSLGWRHYAQALADHFILPCICSRIQASTVRNVPCGSTRSSTSSASIPGFWKRKGWRAVVSSAECGDPLSPGHPGGGSRGNRTVWACSWGDCR